MPETLVHGDFSAKNVRIRQGQHGLELLPLDWDAAGWGVAAADVSQIDVVLYWSIIRQHLPNLSLDAVKRFANVGRMFWNLEPVTGEAETLASDWVQTVMRKMIAYETEIADALRAMGWLRVRNNASN
jgi:aminoglycoside phosphotransferase (APT) family kinase protein